MPASEAPLHSSAQDKSECDSAEEFSALNALIHNRGARWSHQARAIKFDIEFKTVEQERRRVAKELHDEILPCLARLTRLIQAHCDASTTSRLVDELHGTVAAFRDLLGELHPVDLEELGLVPALSNICKRYARLSERCLIFVEHDEHCLLSDFQQLCMFRAIQSVLKMFRASGNDILLVTYACIGTDSMIAVRCVDKSVSSAEWLSAEHEEFDSFESWCSMAGARVQIGTNHCGEEFPYDLVISAAANEQSPEDFLTLIGQLTQVRLQELDSILALAQEEWTNLINRDCALFKNLTIAVERKKISQHINDLILPRLDNIVDLSRQREMDRSLRLDINERMQVIANGVNAVMSELHPRLLAEAGLIPSIAALVERFKRASLIEAKFSGQDAAEQVEEIPLEARFAIYRVIQESLNNIEKHSLANRALVNVKQTERTLSITIEDDGKGFQEPKSTLSRGLKNIRERAREIGALVTWESSRSFATGTVVTITLECAEPRCEPN